MALMIPPVWQHVWISPWPNGHIQATGIDAAGRKQYLYHMEWSTRRHTQKFERVVGFGAALPRARQFVAEHLVDSDFSKDRVLATAFRLLDRGHFGSAVRCTPIRTGASALATEHPDGLPGVPYRPSVHRRIRTESAHTTAVNSAMRSLGNALPEVVDEKTAGTVLTMVAATPSVERAVLKLLLT